MCFVWISEQTAIISLYNINWLVCITQTECVYCAVRTVFMCFVWISEQTAIISLYTKVYVLLYPTLPDFKNNIAFWKIPRLRPFVLPVRAACRWRWLWSNGGMMTGGKPNYSEKNLSQRNLSTTSLIWTYPGSKPGLRGWRPVTNRLSHGTVLLYGIDWFVFIKDKVCLLSGTDWIFK
jgi:hypothetical protein